MLTKDSLIVTTSWDDGTIADLRLAELLEKYGIAEEMLQLYVQMEKRFQSYVLGVGRKYDIRHLYKKKEKKNFNMVERLDAILNSNSYKLLAFLQEIASIIFPRGSGRFSFIRRALSSVVRFSQRILQAIKRKRDI